MLTITTRLTFWYFGTFGSIIIIVAIAVYATYASSESVTLDDEMRDYAEFVALRIQADSLHPDLTEQLTELTAETRLRFRPIRLVLTDGDSVLFDNIPVNLALDSARIGQPSFQSGFQTITYGKATYRLHTHTITVRLKKKLNLILIASLDRIYRRLAMLRNLFLIVIPVALIVATIGGWFMARRALAPVASITSTADIISSSNLDRRVPVSRSNDELAALAHTFNRMIARLESSFNSQRRFVADVSHDLRTPLTIIRAELELLLQRNDLNNEIRTSLEQGIREIDRLSQLASDLLLLARADANQLQPTREEVRLDELLVDCVGLTNIIARGKNIAMQITISDPIEISCDARMIRRAITNILGNSIKYSPNASTVRTTLESSNGTATIVISDSGIGMTPEELPRIFDRFYRGDAARSTHGSGLGLSISRAIIEAHAGQLELRSSAGQGTSVTISLPL